MSSPPPRPPKRPKIAVDNFKLPPAHQGSNNKQSTIDLNLGDNLPQSSLAPKKQPFSGNATVSELSTQKKSYILDWLHGRLPEPSTGKDLSKSSPKPDLNTTDSGPSV